MLNFSFPNGAKVDARADQDKLLDELRSVSELTCIELLSESCHREGASSAIWDAWHAVKRCYYGSGTGVSVGNRDQVPGFNRQVGDGNDKALG